MSEKGTHEQIEQFKSFVKKHPLLIDEVRQKRKTWKELYEDWYILGEDDETWSSYREQTSSESNPKKKTGSQKGSSDMIGQLLQAMKKIDMNQMQKHIAGLSGAISNIQQLMEQFGGARQQQQPPSHSFHQPQGHVKQGPFSFKD